MVQPANMRSFDYTASLRRLDRPTSWRVFRQGQVRSERVVVVDVIPHHAPQVALAKNDRVVQALSTY